MPEEKIISRYDKALDLVNNLLQVFDICHIYDNSGDVPHRIFKKRKNQYFYDECEDWYFEDIQALTEIDCMELKELN